MSATMTGTLTGTMIRNAAVIAAIIFIFPASLAFAQKANSSDNVIRIGYQKYGTLVLLKAHGSLEKRLAPLHIEVQWTEFPAGPQLLEGLNVGSIDFGTVGEAPPIFAQAAGADLVYVGNEPSASAAEAIVVPANSPIKSVNELKGKESRSQQRLQCSLFAGEVVGASWIKVQRHRYGLLNPGGCACRFRARQRRRVGYLGTVSCSGATTNRRSHHRRWSGRGEQPPILPRRARLCAETT